MTLTPTIGIQGGYQVLTLRDGSWIEDVASAAAVSAVGARSRRGRSTRSRVEPQELAGREALVVAAGADGGGRWCRPAAA